MLEYLYAIYLTRGTLASNCYKYVARNWVRRYIWTHCGDKFGNFPASVIQNLLRDNFLFQWHNLSLQVSPDKN